MTDRERLLLLLDAVPDYTFEPETSTGKMLRRSTLRGPAPHHKGPCPTCNGVGRLQRDRPCAACRLGQPREGHACVKCESCKGRGKVDYDGYTNKPVTTDVSSPEPRTDQEVRERKARDRARIDALLGGADDPPFDCDALDAYIDKLHTSAGSIPQVIRLLDELRLRNHLVYRMVVSVHVLHLRSEAKMHRALRRRLECGLLFLQRAIVKPIRIPRELLERERIRSARVPAHRMASVKGKGDGQLPARDREIRRLYAEGESAASIAAAFRLSRAQVHRIVRDANGSNGKRAA